MSRTWSSAPSMSYRRWYGTVTALPEAGSAIAFGGSQYVHAVVFGGTEDPTSSTSSTHDELQRLALTQGGQWDPQVTATSPWPEPREGHIAVYSGTGSTRFMTIFGGRTTGGDVLGNTWQLRTNQEDTYESYAWTDLNPFAPLPGDNPGARYRHGAVLRTDGNMVVYGGSADAAHATVSDKVHRLWYNGAPINRWEWQLLSAGGTAPGARYGHAVAYDAQHNRMIVFGGRRQGGALANDKVYTLDFGSNPPLWEEFTVAGAPAAREGHSLVPDPTADAYSRPGGTWRRMILFGGQAASEKKKDAWALWIKTTDPAAFEWEQVADCPGGCPGRTRHAATWDADHSRMVVFGGDMGAGPADAGAWALKKTGTGTSLIWQPALASHPSAGLAGATAIPSQLLFARQPEVFSAGSWSTTSVQPKLQIWYPFMFVLPSGNLFHAGGAGMRMTHVLNRGVTPWAWNRVPNSPACNPFCPSNSPFDGSSAVMFRPGQIMKCGYAGNDPPHESSAVITFDAADVTTGWTLTGSLAQRRHDLNLVLLPGGLVLATGGTTSDGAFVQGPEIWDPVAGTWSGYGTLAPDPAMRGYHSTSLLLPDGRVLSAGGIGLPSFQTKVTIYCPPYLFNASGQLATRPEIVGAPAQLAWGQTFTVCVADTTNIRGACLIRPGAVTHAFDQNQRRVPLQITGHAGGPQRLFLTAPANSYEAPPGDYLLFLTGSTDGTDVPSVARWVRVQGPEGADLCDEVAPGTIQVGPEVVSSTEIHLTWDATADDGFLPASGKTKRFDLRVSGSAINSEYKWSIAAPVPGLDPPGPVGTFHQKTLTVAPCAIIHFSLRAEDDRPTLGALPPDIWVQTPGSGCGGGGTTSARPVDGKVEGGPTPVTGGSTGVGIGSATGLFSAGSAELAGSSSVQSPGAPLVVETRRLPDGGWQVSLRLATESDGLDPAASSITVERERAGGGHEVLGEFTPGESENVLALCSLRERGRLAIPGFTQVERVLPRVRRGGQDYALSEARHSRLGPLGAEFVALGGSVELLAGDVVDLAYAPAAEASQETPSCYVLVRRLGSAPPTPFARRPALGERLPERFALYPNEPSPAQGSTLIRFDLPVESPVKLEVFDLLGRRVAMLADRTFPAGTHAAQWNLRDPSDAAVRPGVYVYRLTAGEFRAKGKISVVP